MSAVPPQGGKDAWVRDQMQKIGRLVDEELPQDWAFFIMAFPLEDASGRCNYCSNAQREDVLKLMANFIKGSTESPGAWMTHSEKSI